jgi:general secretion pathway protein G
MQLRRTTRAAARRGFTLMEIMVVVIIIVVLAGVGIFYLMPQVDQARRGVAVGQLKALTEACDLYKLYNGDYPPTLEALAMQQPNGGMPIIKQDALLDPWGNHYGYDPSGQHTSGLAPDIWVNHPNPQFQVGNWPGGH